MIFFLGCFAACRQMEPDFEQILRLENRRVACDSLQNFLSSPKPEIRARAVEALGKLQDDRCRAPLLKMLNDPSPNVRLEAAFALGQLGQSSAEQNLIDALHSKEIIEVKARVVEALGKIGAERSIPVLAELMKDENSVLRAEAALSAGRMALRSVTHPDLTAALTQRLRDPSAEVRWKASYSLMRIGEGLPLEQLRQAVDDADARVRLYAAQALANAHDPAILETLGKMIKSDPDWRVRVKAANALGKFSLRRMANYVNFSDQNPHVRIALIQAIGSSALLDSLGYSPSSREHNLLKHQLEQILATNTDHETNDNEKPAWTPAEIGMALISYAQLLKEEAVTRIAEFANHAHPRVRARAMQALGETGAAYAIKIFESNYVEAPVVVKIAILESINKLNNSPDAQIFLKALNENDQALVAIAAQGLSQDALRNRIYAQHIITAYQNLPKPVDAEAAQMIFNAMQTIGDTLAVPVLMEALNSSDIAVSKAAANALQKLTGQDYSPQRTSHPAPQFNFSHRDIDALKGARARIKTACGNIEILFYTYDAPLTVLNFVRLAEKGFFDGLTFHRVVPNFVIQGGDPRGDSWGSPGYAIRSEFNKRPFIRGTVGMASAGKDTEGCQFFITHSEQPHLDGRYTVFGQVISGMEVVDKIQEGDVMARVTIRR